MDPMTSPVPANAGSLCVNDCTLRGFLSDSLLSLKPTPTTSGRITSVPAPEMVKGMVLAAGEILGMQFKFFKEESL